MQLLNTFTQCLLTAVKGNSSIVVFPFQDNYSAIVNASSYNRDIQVQPAAIVFPESSYQVAAAVKCAVDSGIKVQARSGGHSYGNYGLSSGQLSIDLRNLRGFTMDQSSGLATVGAGTLLGELNEQLWASGQRYIPHGLSFSIGIGGHATVGGFGVTSRLAGLASDHITEAEIVLSNSVIVRASEAQNSDLFFAIRGAAASFGIVTEFVFQSDPAPSSTVSYAYVWTVANSFSRSAVVKAWQKWHTETDVPWELSSTLTLSPISVVLSGVFVGTQAGFDALNISAHFPTPQLATAQVFTSYRQLSEVLNQEVEGLGEGQPSFFYAKSLLFRNNSLIPEVVIDQLIEYLDSAENGTQTWVVNFELGGGFFGTIPVAATAFPYRDATFDMLSYGQTIEPVTKTTVKFLNELSSIAASGNPGASYGQYAGFVDPREDNNQARHAYWGVNLERLQAIKMMLDPDDVFHNQQSIMPGTTKFSEIA